MEVYINNELVSPITMSYTNPFAAIVSTVTLQLPYDFDVKAFGMEAVKVKSGNQLVFTGDVMSISKSNPSTGTTLSISAASTANRVQDCTLHSSLDSVQFSGNSLKQIAEEICNPYDTDVYYSPVCQQKELQNEIVENLECKRTDKIVSILSKISIHLGLIVRHDERGGILFTFPDTNDKTVASFTDSNSEISISFNTQKCFDDVNMIEELKLGDIGTSEQVYEETSGLNLPKTKEITYKSQFSNEQKSSEDEVKSLRSKMYSSIKVMVKFKDTECDMIDGGWIGQDRGVIIAGDVIEVQSDVIQELSIATRFMVNNVTVKETAKNKETILTCVPHETYTNEQIKKFW